MIKIAAALLMLIDHVGMVFFKEYLILRIIGRLAMPLFAYSVAAGFDRTRSFKRYLIRMGVFAVASQVPYWMMQYAAEPQSFSFLHFNIGFTFLGALITLYLYKKIKADECLSKIVNGLLILGILMLSTLLKCDYGAYAILVVLAFYEGYVIRKNALVAFCMLILATASLFLMGRGSHFYIQLYALPAFFIILGVKDKPIKGFGYFFYIFYPLHMAVLGIIKWIYF